METPAPTPEDKVAAQDMGEAKTSEESFEHCWASELSQREIFFIGSIIVQWGALEHEVFTQTLLTFHDPEVSAPPALPKAMNNLQFTEVLNLWKERVIGQAQTDRAKVLDAQFREISKLKSFRDALVHGMWSWPGDALSEVTTIRIRKKDIITTRFTAEDLADFNHRLELINFKLRFPGGIDEYADKLGEQGSFMSRELLTMMAGASLPLAGRTEVKKQG